MRPIVTVGLPCFNEEKFVSRALTSILAQSFQDWELIAIDDGSNDATADILRGLRDPRIRIVIDGRHRGLPARLNEIGRQATGKYVARMDADDMAHPQRLQRQIEFLESHPAVDVLGTGMAIVDEGENVIGKRISPQDPYAMSGAPVIAHATMCSRAEWARQHPYDELSGCEDWALWRTAGKPSCRNLEAPLYFYREFDSYSLRKYLRRKMAILSGAAFAGDVGEALNAVMGMSVYTLAKLTGTTRRLIARRSALLTGDEQADLQRTYDSVLQMSLEEAQQTAMTGNPQSS